MLAARDVADQCVAALNARDADAFIALSAEDVEVVPVRAALEETNYRGHEGIVQWMRDIDEDWQELRLDVQERIEIDATTMLAVGVLHARGKASEALTTTPIALVAWVRDGKLVKGATFPDRASAERAIAAES